MLRSRHAVFVPLLLLALLAGVSGCGYQGGVGNDFSGNGNAPDNKDTGYQWKSIYRQDVRTVHVPIFTNIDYQRGVEFSLSKALVNQIEANTPYKVVPRERADTVLEGSITSIKVNTLSQDTRSAIPQEQLLDITVDFTWKDLRTGRALVTRHGVQSASTYYPTLGEGRETGTQLAVERMAMNIVQQMQSEW